MYGETSVVQLDGERKEGKKRGTMKSKGKVEERNNESGRIPPNVKNMQKTMHKVKSLSLE